MAKIVEVRTQAELEVALKAGHIAELISGVFSLVTGGTDAPELIVRAGVELSVVAWGSSQPRVVARESSQPRVEARGSSQPRVEARGSSQPRVEARESSQPRVVAWGSSQPRVVARESSQPRVVARESSQPRVVAWESSQPRVEAWGSSQPRVEARGSSQPRVEARGFVQLSIFGRVIAKCTAQVSALIQGNAEVEGGQQTRVAITTAQEWCDYYGVPVVDGVATLFKAVGPEFRSSRGDVFYTPGSAPEAADWDGGKVECGGGLHFSPSPAMAREFFSEPAHYVACPVALSDIAVHPTGQYPQKVKARRVCAPCWEVDEDGERIE